MKTITIGFSKSKKKFPIGSWLIRAYMGTPYSHVYLRFYSKSLDRTLIYEAVGDGVRFIGLKSWENHAAEVDSFDLEISEDIYISLLQYCVDNAGYEYGFMQNIGIVLAKVLNLNTNPFQTGSNCSEEVYKILQLSGYSLDKNKNLVTPKDINEALKKS